MLTRTPIRSPLLLHGLWLAAFALLVAPTLLFLWEKWTRNIWSNGHGIFMPILLAILIRYSLRREPVKQEEPSAWGFALLIPALFLVAVDSAIRTELLSAFALLLCLPGLSLLFLGPRRTRALLFPFAISSLMLPIPAAFMTQLHLVLRRMTTLGTGEALHLLGRPVYAEGTELFMPTGTFQVVEECSGWSAIYAGFTVALVLAYLSHSWWRRVLLLAAPLPLALASNVLRITVLALLAEWLGYHLLDTPIHVLSGYATFLLTLALIFLLAERSPRARA
jgi:exosortase